MKWAPVAAAALMACAPSCFAHEFDYFCILTGPTAATGTVFIHTDLDVVDMRVQVFFSGLTGPTTGAQIHGRTAVPGVIPAGTAVPLSTFPLSVTSGSDDETMSLGLASTYDPSFITASGGTVTDALGALAFGLDEGRMYVEIQTSAYPGGELRGFLTLIPEPGTLTLLGCGGMLLLRRRKFAAMA